MSDFYQEILGFDLILKRNNVFISKSRIYQLIREGKIKKPEILVPELANQI